MKSQAESLAFLFEIYVLNMYRLAFQTRTYRLDDGAAKSKFTFGAKLLKIIFYNIFSSNKNLF